MQISSTDIVVQALSAGLDISYKNLISIRNHMEEDGYIVEYESYFNPHSYPYQLMDKKEFTSMEEAATFFVDYINNLDFS